MNTCCLLKIALHLSCSFHYSWEPLGHTVSFRTGTVYGTYRCLSTLVRKKHSLYPLCRSLLCFLSFFHLRLFFSFLFFSFFFLLLPLFFKKEKSQSLRWRLLHGGVRPTLWGHKQLWLRFWSFRWSARTTFDWLHFSGPRAISVVCWLRVYRYGDLPIANL